MNILALSHEYPPIGGGGANAAYHLLNGFAGKGHKVTLITTAYAGREFLKQETMLEICTVDSRRSAPDQCSFGEMLDYLIKAYRLAKRLVSEAIAQGTPYDECLVFFGIPSGPIAYMLKKKYKLPYMIRFGGGDIPGAQKRFKYIYPILAPAIRTIWRNAQYGVANSAGLKREAESFYKNCSYRVINNGVDTDKYVPLDSSHGDQTFNILAVGRLIPVKGLQYFIPMLDHIRQSTAKNIVFTVVGDGPYREYLEKMTSDTHVEDIVRFVGKKTGADLLSEYQTADLYVLPSEREGMANTVLEAMSCRLPVVMTPVPGSDEMISGNGYITEIKMFADRVIELINNDELRNHMGELSRERVINLFSWENSVNQYITLMSGGEL